MSVDPMNHSTAPVVLITGAARGIGRHIARACARDGFTVAINYNTSDAAAVALQQEIVSAGGRAILCQTDITDRAAVKKMVSDLFESTGRIDVLINNAGIACDNPVLKMTAEQFDSVVRTCLDAPFMLVQECSRHMMKQRHGAVINIGSIVGLRGSAGAANYAAAKGGIISLTKTVARELGRFNICCNTVLPGFHATGMGVTVSDVYRKKVLEESVLGTTTDIDELARFVVMLAHTRTVSGQVFNWDSRII
jgi:3-oxoacyl-[acyl-carrier protein] reductase